jgi:hypothetical protein
MPKYLLLKHYSGSPGEGPDFAPMNEWTPEECEAHFQLQRDTCHPDRASPPGHRRASWCDLQRIVGDLLWASTLGPLSSVSD